MSQFKYRADTEGMLNTYLDWYKQAEYILSLKPSLPDKFKTSKGAREYHRPQHIIICGLGGSGIAGDLVKDALGNEIKVPIEIVKEYTLPSYAGEETLVIAVSYSGNTEETLSCYVEAVEKNCMIASISSGGYLKKFSEKTGALHIDLMSGYQPRASLPQLLFAILKTLETLKIVSGQPYAEVIQVLRENKTNFSPENEQNKAKELAEKLYRKIPVIYGHSFYKGVAIRLKNEFNENTKIPAKAEVFPELDHNDIVGWEDNELSKNFTAIILRNEEEYMKERIEATIDIMKKYGAEVIELSSRAETVLAKIMDICHLGGLASIYLALLYGRDPALIEPISLLKKRLGEKVGLQKKLLEKLSKTVSQ
ncbi:MAG: bifunctional phosphoglucose/phosphomannose isomerase [Thermoprotei archaeon]|nr:MAG: bifunctional phosphoglucose/phosphomannose isomerase [Thermoprotei archaeon]